MCHTKECGFLRINGLVIDPAAPRSEYEAGMVTEYYNMVQEYEDIMAKKRDGPDFVGPGTW